MWIHWACWTLSWCTKDKMWCLFADFFTIVRGKMWCLFASLFTTASCVKKNQHSFWLTILQQVPHTVPLHTVPLHTVPLHTAPHAHCPSACCPSCTLLLHTLSLRSCPSLLLLSMWMLFLLTACTLCCCGVFQNQDIAVVCFRTRTRLWCVSEPRHCCGVFQDKAVVCFRTRTRLWCVSEPGQGCGVFQNQGAVVCFRTRTRLWCVSEQRQGCGVFQNQDIAAVCFRIRVLWCVSEPRQGCGVFQNQGPVVCVSESGCCGVFQNQGAVVCFRTRTRLWCWSTSCWARWCLCLTVPRETAIASRRRPSPWLRGDPPTHLSVYLPVSLSLFLSACRSMFFPPCLSLSVDCVLSVEYQQLISSCVSLYVSPPHPPLCFCLSVPLCWLC